MFIWQIQEKNPGQTPYILPCLADGYKKNNPAKFGPYFTIF